MLHILHPSLLPPPHTFPPFSGPHAGAHSYFASALFDFILPRLLFFYIFFRVLFSGMFLYSVACSCLGYIECEKQKNCRKIRERRKVKHLLFIQGMGKCKQNVNMDVQLRRNKVALPLYMHTYICRDYRVSDSRIL